ncbi:type IV pilin protein [Francisella philomiragia]|uniref:type IV pilin protein n=1 Tax=Francisella philomiragia TaxID=28110 RepID=UPI0035150DF3
MIGRFCNKQSGFSLIELVIAMTIIAIVVLAYERISYEIKSTSNLLDNNQELVDVANNRFNEFIATGILDTSSTPNVTITQSGSVYDFQSNKDTTLKLSVKIV